MTKMEHLDAAMMAAYLDHGLAPAERERAVAHLGDCGECRVRLLAQIRAKVGAAAADLPARRRAWVPLVAGAAIGVLLVAAGVWYALEGRERSGGGAEREPRAASGSAARAPGAGSSAAAGSAPRASGVGMREPGGRLLERPAPQAPDTAAARSQAVAAAAPGAVSAAAPAKTPQAPPVKTPAPVTGQPAVSASRPPADADEPAVPERTPAATAPRVAALTAPSGAVPGRGAPPPTRAVPGRGPTTPTREAAAPSEEPEHVTPTPREGPEVAARPEPAREEPEPDVSAPREEPPATGGATRSVAGKTFRLQNGQWVDSAYRAEDQGAPRGVVQGTAAYEALLAREPRLARWSQIGRVLVVLDSTPYRILPSTR